MPNVHDDDVETLWFAEEGDGADDEDEMECEHLRMRDDDVECPDCGAEAQS